MSARKTTKKRKLKRPTKTLKSVRVAVCGCGVMGRQHVSNLLELPDVDLVALADTDHAVCSRLRDEVLVPRGKPCSIFHTLQEQLRLARVDAVVIATPHSLHYEQVRAALEAGVHVLVEKPMVTSTAQARNLMNLARRRKRVLAVSYQGTCTDELAYIREVISRGELGEVTTIDGFISQDWLNLVRGTWRLKKEQSGGGMLYDTGSHLLHGILWLTGLKPVEVSAWVDRRGQKVDIIAGMLVRFDNGALATLLSNGDARFFDSRIRINGTLGTVVTSAYGGRLEHYAGGELLKYPSVMVRRKTPQSDFVEAIRGKVEPVSPAEWGLKLCRLMEAVYASAECRKPVKVTWR